MRVYRHLAIICSKGIVLVQRGTGQKPLGSLLSSAATTLRSLINAPWYVTNETIHRDFKIPTIKDEIYKSRSRYNARDNNHHNPIVTQILHTTDQIRRLKRKYPLEKKKKKNLVNVITNTFVSCLSLFHLNQFITKKKL